MTADTKAKAGFCGSYKAEFLTEGNMNYIVGIEYVSQQFLFNGYYTAPGYTYVYDRTFAYAHDVQVQELQIPLGIKTTFAAEQSYDYTPYFTGGMKFRYILKTYTVITDDSTNTTVYDGNKLSVSFESKIPAPRINTCVYAGFGFQRNYRGTGRALFFEMTYSYGLSRFVYTGFNNSNNLAISNSFLAFTIGWKI